MNQKPKRPMATGFVYSLPAKAHHRLSDLRSGSDG